MSKIDLRILITFILMMLSLEAFGSNTGWSGKVISNPEFESILKDAIEEDFLDQCDNIIKNHIYPVNIQLGYDKSNSYKFFVSKVDVDVKLSSFDLRSEGYKSEVFKVEITYNILKNESRLVYPEEFSFTCY